MKRTEIEAILFLALVIAATTLFYWYCQSSIVTVEAKVLSSSCISSSSSSFVKIGVSSSGRKTHYSNVEVEFPDGTKRYLSSPGEYGGQLKVGDRIKVATRLNSDFLAVDEFNYDLLSKREANCQSE